MLTVVTLTLASSVLAALAVAMACVLGWANQVFHVEVDPKVEAIDEALPGANCGGCGYVGCSEYAEAVAKGETEITLCGPGGASCVEDIGEIMGISVDETLPYRAVVHCVADKNTKLKMNEYQGEMTCASANLISGYQGCTYGCLGLGDCVRSCDYDAIHNINGIAVVNYNKCIGCKACAMVCPRNIISMVPFRSETMLVVACSNQDFGPEVKKVCKVGCIGCKSCEKKSCIFKMDGNLPTIDYETYDPEADVAPALEKCPMESLVYVGKPSMKDVDTFKDEAPPKEPVKADFKTTVDDTEWRG